METQQQISADDILQDAFKKKAPIKPATKVEILDLEELKEFQRRKRTEFESNLKVKRFDVRQWIRYAKFEIGQHDMRRARSIFERALQVNNQYVPLWIKYIDSELKAKNINHARNLLDRACNLLPRVEKLWLKYVIVEESLGNVSLVRSLFSRWCSLSPSKNAYDAYVGFETRCGEFDKARKVYSGYVSVHPAVDTWLKWVAFEKRHGSLDTTRQVFSLGLDTLSLYDTTSDADVAAFVAAFAEWESLQQEHDRSTALYLLASQKWPDNENLERSRVQFEKMHGTHANIDDSILVKRKRDYERSLSTNKRDYETWWIYLDLLQKHFPYLYPEACESSITGNIPEEQTKGIEWKRYIYLWIRYLLYLELDIEDIPKTRSSFETLVKDVIPHKKFTFAKIWVMYSKFELRQEDLAKARKIFGYALGTCPKQKIFKEYINFEIQLKEFDRVRKIYEQLLAFDPLSNANWIAYAELEENLGDEDRARGIYHIAISENLGLPNESKVGIIKRLISFETDLGEYENARAAYRTLLALSNNSAKIWTEMALFESTIPADNVDGNVERDDSAEDSDEETFEITENNKQNTRRVFEEALVYQRNAGDNEGRIFTLNALIDYENVHGTDETQTKAKQRLPRKVVRAKMEGSVETESVEYEFPDDKNHVESTRASKLFAMAQKWKQETNNDA